jgi:activator of 2-hydroxyglutaryl-CoA dehydratase
LISPKQAHPPAETVLCLGIDIGSTTVKLAALDHEYRLIFSCYKRHYADLMSTLRGILCDLEDSLGDACFAVSVTGSGGLSLSETLKLRSFRR